MADNRASELNGGDDDDEALRLAIALSLSQDPSQGTDSTDLIDLTQDDNLDESALASVEVPSKKPGDLEPAPPAASATGLSLLGLDRKKMEEERLARLKKRKAQEIDGAEDSAPRQRPRTNDDARLLPVSTLSKPTTQPKLSHQSKAAVEVQGANIVGTDTNLPFPGGVVKKTWASGQPRLGNDIKIEEVLQKTQLELAVLSSYQWDDDWLISKVDLRRTKLILMAFASDEAQVGCLQGETRLPFVSHFGPTHPMVPVAVFFARTNG